MKNICIALVLAQCFLQGHLLETGETNSKVIGGQLANLAEIYYQVSVQVGSNITGNHTHMCGGTIVNYKYVLTAAKCLYDSGSNAYNAEQIRVVSETINIASRNEGQIIFVSKIVIHDKFSIGNSHDNDVALLLLFIPFTESQSLKAIEMNSDELTQNTECVISGYSKGSTNLTRGTVSISNKNICQTIYGEDMITGNMVCAGGTGSNICMGDEGGPLVCNGKLAGIASFTTENCNAAYPGVFIEVAKYKDWVLENGGLSMRSSMVVVVFAYLISFLLM